MVKIGIVVAQVEAWNPWSDLGMTPPQDLPMVPVVPPTWHVKKVSEAFRLAPYLGQPRPDLTKAAYLHWVGVERTINTNPYRAFEMAIPFRAVPFYRGVLDNVFFWATINQLRSVKNGEQVPNRDSQWHTRAGILITDWEAARVLDNSSTNLRVLRTLAGLDFAADAERTQPEDLEAT